MRPLTSLSGGMLVLIQGGEVYAPEYCGKQSVLLTQSRIVRIGDIDPRRLEASGLGIRVVDGSGCLVVPGFIDVHEHLIGGSGEKGYASQTPEISMREIVEGGVTTVVGCLGVDTSTKTMPALLAKVKALNESGITAFLWSGGYDVPPVTLTGSVRTDLLFVSEVIGAGEIAISDHRSLEPGAAELARLVQDAANGGMLSGKAGVSHFHVGEGRRGLAILRQLLDEFDVRPESLYPTHVERSEALMREAVDLTKRGVTVDIDTVEEDLPRWVSFYLHEGGESGKLTASSDAAIKAPATLFRQLRACVVEHRLPIEMVLCLVTSNPAKMLRLPHKGILAPGADADVVVLHKNDFQVKHVFARGTLIVEDGAPIFHERWRQESNRRF